jgi:type IV pilus assembly protein PilA
MKTLQKGFTLIELMIVVAIVGILAAIALPAYQDYIVRAKMTEPLAKLDEMKVGIAEYVASNNATPATGVEAGLGAAGVNTVVDSGASAVAKYYNGIGYQEVNKGLVVAVGVRLNGAANANLADKWVIMTGNVDSPGTASVLWGCSTDLDTKYRKYLPSNCRATGAITAN